MSRPGLPPGQTLQQDFGAIIGLGSDPGGPVRGGGMRERTRKPGEGEQMRVFPLRAGGARDLRRPRTDRVPHAWVWKAGVFVREFSSLPGGRGPPGLKNTLRQEDEGSYRPKGELTALNLRGEPQARRWSPPALASAGARHGT